MRLLGYAAAGTLAFLLVHVSVSLYYEPAVAPLSPERLARTPWQKGEATLLIAGDTAEIDAALPVLGERGLEYPFSLTVDRVRDADLAIANAEAPITDGGRRFPIYKDYVYRAPAGSARALAWAGFDVLGLANNHTTDYGDEGLADTMALARAAGLATVGAGADAREARRGLIVELGGVRVGILAYCEQQLLWRLYVDQFARARHPGVAALSERALVEDLARLRPQADVLVVLLHAGDNYAPPTAATVRWAERAIDAGADLVVAHHPHVAHPVMQHRGRPILLSLGNYAFGSPGHPALDYGWLAYAHLAGRRLDRVELEPLAVQNRRVQFRPAPLDGDELTRALSRMQAESAARGTKLRIERGRVILDLQPW